MVVMPPNDKQIFESISSMMEELFEIPKGKIKMDSHLNEDLDLDSIDAIDLIVKLQEYSGKRLDPERFKSVRTVSDAVSVVKSVLLLVENQPIESPTE